MYDPRGPRRPRHSDSLPSRGGGSYSSYRGTKRRHSDHEFNAHKRQRQDPGYRVPAPRPFEYTRKAEDGVVLGLRGFPNDGEDIDKVLIQEAVEVAFEGMRYEDKAINFECWARSDHNPVAFVVLHTYDIAQQFFDEEREIYWYGEPLYVTVESREAKPDTVETLRNSVYVPVAAVRERDALNAELGKSTPVQSVAFGVWCRSQIFSREHGVFSERGVLQEDGTRIEICFDTKRLSLQLRRPEPRSWIGGQWITPSTTMLMPVRDIRAVWADAGQHTVLFHMYCPVSFERHDGELKRVPGFDATHAKIASFTCSTLLLSFSNREQYDAFLQRMTKAPHFPPVVQRAFVVREAKVYDDRHITFLDKWYKQLPLSISLQCEQALHNGVLTPVELKYLKAPILALLSKESPILAAEALQNLIVTASDCDTIKNDTLPDTIEQMLELGVEKAKLAVLATRGREDRDMAMCHQVFVTPTGMILEGPFADKSNRILRLYPEYHHHFMRVTFTEEGGQSRRLRFPGKGGFDFKEFIYRRIGNTLNDGFDLAGHHWEWLGYSQSALKDRQMLFMTPFHEANGDALPTLVNSDVIRKRIGIFTKVNKQPAKYGARIAQAFSATSASVELAKKEFHEIPDIIRNGNCFTDGAGDMSPDMAASIWGALNRRRRGQLSSPPSAFQARFAGCKGVWMVNPELEGKILRYTPSQEKFKSDSRSFDVANHSERPGTTFLNRPLVKLLEDLLVPPETFLLIQSAAVKNIERALLSFTDCAELFEKHTLGLPARAQSLLTNLSTMLHLDFDMSPQGHTDFLKSAAMLAITSCLREIKYKARIEVQGPTLIGVCDTWKILDEGEIYVKLMTPKKIHRALMGKVLVTRSPVIHPGDVQFATAIGEVPPDSPLASLFNVVVFSSRGKRCLPSMLGGGDLDGDLFNVITDPDLFPQMSIQEPGNYDPAEPKVLDRPSEMSDIAEFVCDYVLGDTVGIISTRHLSIADASPKGCFDEDCLELAKLASHAVDFVKSGRPVTIQQLPFPHKRSKPDFLAREDELEVYRSEKVLGKMFRAVPIQKYARAVGETQDNIDASVLHQILTAVEKTYGAHLGRDSGRNADLWEILALTFCDECERIAFRNSVSQRDDHRLGEEDLFVGTTGSVRLESGELDLMHRARVQMSAHVRGLRASIKDLKKGDVDIDDDGEKDEDRGMDESALKKEEELAVYGLMDDDDDEIQEIRRPASVKPVVVPKVEQDDDDDIREVDASAWGEQCDNVKRETTNEVGNDAADDEDIQEIEDWRLRAISRAAAAAWYAFDLLKQEPPFGTRLFAMTAVETLLSLLKSMSVDAAGTTST